MASLLNPFNLTSAILNSGVVRAIYGGGIDTSATNNNNNSNNRQEQRGSSASRGRDNARPVDKNIQKYFTNCKSLYSCIHCRAHLANHDELVSRNFQGNHSRAYLFNAVINVTSGPPVQRSLNTGEHHVADVFCKMCKTLIGWKYERAHVESQKYKEGKFIIELGHCVRENRQLEVDKGEMILNRSSRRQTIGRRPNGSPYKSRNSISSTNCQCNQNLACSSATSSGLGSSVESGQPSSSILSSPLSKSPLSSSSPPTNKRDDCCMHSKQIEEDGNTIARDVDSNDDDLDDELMFPFNEDICAHRISSASSLSPGHRNLHPQDSTPYDWKRNDSSKLNAS